MAKKRKKYNAKFPPARVKKIMQKDEEVGKVAAAVPVIIARALEFFVMDLMSKANERILSKNAKTLTPEHIKQTVNMVEEFAFLKELVAPISDVQSNNNHTQASKQTSKQKHEGKQETEKPKQEPSSSSSSSFSLPPDETTVFKVPTRGRPKKSKAPSCEAPAKSKKMKINDYISLLEEPLEGGSIEDEAQQVFHGMPPDSHAPEAYPNTPQNTPPLPPPIFPSPTSSLPHPSFPSPTSQAPNHILVQPSLEPLFNNNQQQLTTSTKLADALHAVNNNTHISNNNNDVGILNNSNNIFTNNIFNYNNNTLLPDIYNTPGLIQNHTTSSFSTTTANNTINHPIITITPTNTTTNSHESSTHMPTDFSQPGEGFSPLDEVLDLSKQSSNQEAADHVISTFARNHQVHFNTTNNNTYAFASNNSSVNIFANNNNNHSNNNANIYVGNNARNNTSFNKSNSVGNINLEFNNSAENRPNELYKLNVPNLNSFYHRSTSSS